MQNPSHSGTSTKLGDVLAVSALVAWVVSLVLPGFTAGNEAWAGTSILGYGLFFGWLCRGWAVYANIFFLVALLRFRLGRIPSVSLVLMLALAATLPMFDAVPRGESGATMPIQSWDAGAAVWLLSLSLLTAAGIVRALQSREKPEHTL